MMAHLLAIEVLTVTALVLLAVIGVMVTDPDPVDESPAAVEERITTLVESLAIARIHRDLRATSWTPGPYRVTAADALMAWAATWAAPTVSRRALPAAPVMGQPHELLAGVR